MVEKTLIFIGGAMAGGTIAVVIMACMIAAREW